MKRINRMIVKDTIQIVSLIDKGINSINTNTNKNIDKIVFSLYMRRQKRKNKVLKY